MLSSSLLLLTLTGAVSALNIPALLASLGPAPPTDPRFSNWVAPGPGDVRSPCPGLNALANHGFLNHNGKGITIPDMLTGLAAGMNMGADFTLVIGGAGLLASPNPFGGSFDLNQLDQHDFPIEHDGSISRMDAYFGDNYSFNQRNYDQYLAYFNGKTKSDLKTISTAKHARYEDSLARNPTLTYGIRETIFSYGENAIWVSVLSDPYSGVARMDYFKELFVNERLPVDLGWRPSAAPITLPSLGQMVFELYSLGPDPFGEGAKITADSYKDLLEGVVGGSEILGNLTGGISTYMGL